MQTRTIIKGAMLTASFTLLMMAAAMANAVERFDVPTLLHSIKKGDVVTAEMLTFTTINENQLLGHIISEDDEVLGKEAVRSVRAGFPLYKKQFRTVPTVRKGTTVMVIFKKSGITLTTEGKVMKDAATGELVKFINTASKRLLTGKVQEDGTIMVN